MTSLTYAVVEATERLVAKYGLKDTGSRIGLALDTALRRLAASSPLAMESRVVIRLALDP